MCTLSWWRGSDEGFGVFFNRDEMKDRPEAIPPRIGERNGMRFLAPTDTEAGGTWLLVNERGLCLALLNWYERDAVVPAYPEGDIWSRGQLVSDLADADSLSEVERRLREVAALSRFRPFLLAGFERAGGEAAPILWQWDGQGNLTHSSDPEMPICSSGFDGAGVIASRKEAFHQIVGAGAGGEEALGAFHHDNGQGENTAYTVRMNRPDAQTWSISRIRVFPDRVRFLYEGERPSLSGEPIVSESEMAILTGVK